MKICNKCNITPVSYERSSQCKECSNASRRVIRATSGHTPKVKDIKQRFFLKLDQHSPGQCWIWTAYRDRDGYGRFSWIKPSQLAHRYSYATFVGDIPPGMFVCHKCDNPPCCNPDHLFLGAAKDNTLDMVAKGRGRFPKPGIGEINPRAKLTEEQVISIRRLRAGGVKRVDIANQFAVRNSTVDSIVSRKNWRHVK